MLASQVEVVDAVCCFSCSDLFVVLHCAVVEAVHSVVVREGSGA